MKYVQGNITNELITRSFKIKDIYNNYFIKTILHTSGLIAGRCKRLLGGLNERKCPR